ncbi:MAG: hypothetical protein HQ595_02200, partial [Candidatus Omnitrophica bacterium]|nr:hypothetical protein [Candidatus Omnitrophota bacterium]
MEKCNKITHYLIALVVLFSSSFYGSPIMAQEEFEQEVAGATSAQRLLKRGGVLLKKGQFQIEPSFIYSYFSKNRIVISGFSIYEAILIGRVYAEDAQRDTLVTSLAMRYGLTNNTELELSVPYRYRRDEVTVLADNSARTNDGSGVGDLQAAIYRQLVYEHGNVPDVVLNLSVKSRTGEDPYGLASDEVPMGTGHWGVKTGLTFSKTN